MTTVARFAPLHIALAALASSVMAAMPALAQDGTAIETVSIAAVETALRVEVWPPALGTTPPHLGGAAGATASQFADYRLWIGAGRTSIGVGIASELVSDRLPDGGPSLAALSPPSSMILGLRYQLSARSRVYVDTASLAAGTLPERDLRMGFEFKSAPSTALGIARGTLFRVQWSSRSQVSLRLRGGGLAVALRSQF